MGLISPSENMAEDKDGAQMWKRTTLEVGFWLGFTRVVTRQASDESSSC